MSDYEISAEPRGDLGKGATRRLRSQGYVPGVMYGDNREPAAVKLRANVLKKQLENEAFYSHILTVTLPTGTEQVVLKDLQRHPSTWEVTHVDLLRTSATQTLTMNVPLHFMNEETCPGIKAGGVASHALNDVEIVCLPKDLPEFIEVDMAALEIGDSVHLSDLTMPEGVQLTALGHGDDSVDQLVASVQAARATEIEETGEEGEEGEAGEEPTADEG